MQKVRSWLAKGVVALTVAAALVIAVTHLNAVQAAPAHAAILPAHESQSLAHAGFVQPVYFAPSTCIAPLAAQVHSIGMVTELEPFTVTSPSLAHCMLPLHPLLPTANAFSQFYLNQASQLVQVQK